MLFKIKKFIISAIIVLAGINNVSAAWLENVPQTITQPNGEVIECFATGDEFYHWLHDSKGYTIVLNPDDGFFYYGIREGENVVPSGYLVDSVDPKTIGIPVSTRISKRLYEERKREYTMPFKTFKDAPTTGQVNNLVVYIAFADDSVFSKPRSYYKPYFSHEDSVSLKDYFREVSYNRLFIDTYHYPESPDTTSIVYIDEKPRAYFLKKSSVNPDGYSDGQSGGREHALMKRAIQFVDTQVPDTLDIDMNDDGRVDNVCFVMQGGRAGWSDLLWPHRWALYNEDARINGKRVWDYLLMLEGGFEVGTLCHEFFHVLGAPDLYHYDAPAGTPVACGRWDIMDSNANPPQYMGAFMKYKYGDWIASLPEIRESGSYTLYPLSNPEQNVFKIKSPLSTSEYFVVEYRKREGRYESSAPSSGLVVYRINPGAGNGNAGGPPDEVYVYRPGGSLTDGGALSSAALGNGERNAINDNTDPSCFLYNGGQGGPGGLDIFNVSKGGDSITFEIIIKELYPPTRLVYILTDDRVSLDWYPSYVDGLKNYVVYRNGERLASVNRTEYTDISIVEGENYIYTVTAVYEGANNGESEPSNSVTVTPLGVLKIPYFEDFEEANHGWSMKGSTDGFRWGTSEFLGLPTDNTSKFIGANSVAAGKSTHTLDYAISPRLNLEGYESVILEFDYSLKIWQRFDKLTVKYRRSKTGAWVPFTSLIKSGIGANYKWRHMSIEIPPEAYTEEAQIGFQYDDSNEFAYGGALDNVSIKTNTTGIDEVVDGQGFQVFPNPSSGRFEVVFDSVSDTECQIRIKTIDGREILSESLKGVKRKSLDLSGYPDGIYLVFLETPEELISRKLVKKNH